MTADLTQEILERKVGFSSEVNLNEIQSAINRRLMTLDLVAHRMEVRWGVGRLLDLASAELREKWFRQMERLKEAIIANDLNLVTELIEGCVRGWAKLEQSAEAAGHVTYQPEFWNITVEEQPYWVVRDRTDVQLLGEKAQGGLVVTLEELVRVYALRHANVFQRPQEEEKKVSEKIDLATMNQEIGF